jgi:hypothetical protein
VGAAINKLIVFEGGVYLGTSVGLYIQVDAEWELVGGLDEPVTDLAVFDGKLFVSGVFTVTTGGMTEKDNVAAWDGDEWDECTPDFPVGMPGYEGGEGVRVFLVDGEDLYIGVALRSDCFDMDHPLRPLVYLLETAECTSRIGSATWTPIGGPLAATGTSGSAQRVDALIRFDEDPEDEIESTIWAGGNFSNACSVKEPVRSLIVKLEGGVWVNGGTNAPSDPFGEPGGVQAFAIFDLDGAGSDPPLLFAGGIGLLIDMDGYGLVMLADGVWSVVDADFMVHRSILALATFDDGDGTALFMGSDSFPKLSCTGTGSTERRNAIAKLTVGSSIVEEIGDVGGVSTASCGAIPMSSNGAAAVYSLDVLDLDGAGSDTAGLYIGGAFRVAGCYETACTAEEPVCSPNLVRWGPEEVPVITSQPQSVIINSSGPCAGVSSWSFSLSVTVSGSGWSYQWYKDNVEIAGAASATFAENTAGAADSGSYYVRIWKNVGTAACATSNTVSVTYCIGDADGDGDVDFADVTRVLANNAYTYCSAVNCMDSECGDDCVGSGCGDADGNGVVNFADVTAVLNNYSPTCP